MCRQACIIQAADNVYKEICLTLPGLTEYELVVVLEVVVFGSFSSLSSTSLLPGFAEAD